MKQFKILVALVLALALTMTLIGSAMAGTITVDNVKKGETYHAYKLLNYTNSGDAYSYYLTTAQYTSFGSVLERVGFEFSASSDGTIYTLKNTTMTAEEITAALKNADLTNALQHVTKTAENDGALTFDEDLEVGYWYVTSSLGALTSLQSYDAQALVVEKNTIPEIDKKEKTSGTDYEDGPVDANIGDTVHYQIVITDGTGTDAAITMTDTMTDGLDYTAGSLKIGGNAVSDTADTDDWKVTVNGRVITIEFKAAYVASLDTGDTITVTYDATINKNAVINSATDNENKVELDYSKQHDEDKVYVETYDFLVKKTDGNKFLDGAEFKLYDAATGGNQILLSQDNTGYYKDANGSAETTIDINSADGCNVRGLEPGDYYLEEVVVPGGYNKLAAREKVTVTKGQTATVEVTVVNEAGAQLPSTGGIGTTIFYIAGAVLVLGAAAIVIARRKAEQQ